LDHGEVRRQMLEYLQAKYGMSFSVYASSWPDKLGLTNRKVYYLMYPTGGVPQDFFRVELDTSGKRWVFHDGYVGNLMRPVYEAKAQAIVSRYLPGSIADINSPGSTEVFPDDLDGTSTFDQFAVYAGQHTRIMFGIYVRLSDGQDKEAVSAMLPSLQDELSKVAAYGDFCLPAYLPDDFDALVAPALEDPVRRWQGIPAAGYVKFFLNSSWRV